MIEVCNWKSSCRVIQIVTGCQKFHWIKEDLHLPARSTPLFSHGAAGKAPWVSRTPSNSRMKSLKLGFSEHSPPWTESNFEIIFSLKSERGRHWRRRITCSEVLSGRFHNPAPQDSHTAWQALCYLRKPFVRFTPQSTTMVLTAPKRKMLMFYLVGNVL